MAAFEILQHLDKLKPDGGSKGANGDRSFLCPACGSSNFKVHLNPKSESYGFWTTFGCDCGNTEAGKRKIREALEPARNPNSGSNASLKPARPKRTRSWDYFTPITLEKGVPALTVHRIDDGKGKRKIWQEAQIDGYRAADIKEKVLPYGLTEALQGLSDGAPYVFWVEGEACVDSMRALGLFAVTSIGGAGKFKPERDAGHLPSDRLVVVPDRDKPGIAHMESVAAAHPGCQWLFPFPNTPEWNGSCPASGGLDIADWIEQGATQEHILNGISSRSAPPADEPHHDGPMPLPDIEDLPLSERITLGVNDLLAAHLENHPSKIDAAFAELFKLGVSRDRSQERILMLWAESHGLDISTGSSAHKKVRGRIIGKTKEAPGLRQQLPGFGLDKDLHLLVSDAGAGKTTAMCELATVLTARDKGFLDHESPRSDPEDDPRDTVLVIASDGEGSAFSMWEDYLLSINGIDRGANIEIWAQNDEDGEAPWNVSLHNLERLVKRMAEGDVVAVIADTANAIFRGAGINVGTGPIETYLRLLKQIVCRSAALWITQHTNRNGGTTMKAIGGHPAFQEVPSVVHLIEAKEQADGTKIRIWHVLKLRGSNYRRFSYELSGGELRVTDGHFFQNCREQVLVTLSKQIRVGGFTAPNDLARLTARPPQSIYNALTELRGDKLVRPRGRGYRLTAAGERMGCAPNRIRRPARNRFIGGLTRPPLKKAHPFRRDHQQISSPDTAFQHLFTNRGRDLGGG